MNRLEDLEAKYAELGEEIARLKNPEAIPQMVDIPDRNYAMGKFPVTQREWVWVMGENPSHFKGDENRPVENVSWHDIQEYIKRLNEKTGRNFRLPVEDEWYYCAKAGQNFKYSGSDDIDEVAWYCKNSGGTTHPVGQKKPNAFGLYDMSGNVLEWMENGY